MKFFQQYLEVKTDGFYQNAKFYTGLWSYFLFGLITVEDKILNKIDFKNIIL